MAKLTLLIAGCADWSHTWTACLESRDYEVVRASSWRMAISRLQRSDYDLALLDESQWLKHQSQMQQLLRKGRNLVIMSDAPSKDRFRAALEAGAHGYISKQLDMDALVREIEKVLRRLGLVLKRRRALVVENDPHVLESLRNHLERQQYEVFVEDRIERVTSCIETHAPHVVVVDVRLVDDNDPLDQSGFHLMREIKERYGHALRLVGLTGSPARGTAAQSTGLASRFVVKETRTAVSQDTLLVAVDAAYDELGINDSLCIEFERRLSLLELVGTIKAYRDCDVEQRKAIARELEELIRKLFRRELKVKAYYLAPGRGGSGVVLMRPSIEGTQGNHFVVKFGNRQDMGIELENYRRYVQPFVGRRATQLIDLEERPQETLNLGGLKFTFAGMAVERPQDFATFYRAADCTAEAIVAALQNLFQDTCAPWYRDKRDWTDKRRDSLVRAYEEHLSLTRPDKQQGLRTTLKELLDGRSQRGLSSKPKGYHFIALDVADKHLVYPHPTRFIKRYRRHFPTPRYMCRTHGDLNGRNIFIDERHEVWLIDFYKTGWGPALRDFVQLEAVITFELMWADDLAALYEFGKATISPEHSGDSDIQKRFQNGEFHRAATAIATLRALATHQAGLEDMREYYSSLLFFAIRMLTWEGSFSAEKERFMIRRQHAWLTAAMIAFRLQNWDDWQGWPDERGVITVG